MDTNALFKIGYGLYVLTSNYENIDNGCIINTVIQVTDEPLRIAVVVNKKNYTHELVLNSCVFNLSMLTTETPFKVIEHFGFQSGKDINKFAECEQEYRSKNNVLYIPKYTNSYISCHVVSHQDLGTHTMFFADVVDCEVISDKDLLLRSMPSDLRNRRLLHIPIRRISRLWSSCPKLMYSLRFLVQDESRHRH